MSTKVTLQDFSISNFDQLLDVNHIKGGGWGFKFECRRVPAITITGKKYFDLVCGFWPIECIKSKGIKICKWWAVRWDRVSTDFRLQSITTIYQTKSGCMFVRVYPLFLLSKRLAPSPRSLQEGEISVNLEPDYAVVNSTAYWGRRTPWPIA